MHNLRGSRSRSLQPTDCMRGTKRESEAVPAVAADGAGRIKGSWSPEEDELLRDAVARHGARNWTVISAEIPGRTGKSCRLRWCNQLSPGVHRRAFTPEEDAVIFEEHSKHGNKWATIARKLHGRTDNSVKNHWNSTLRRNRRAAAAAAASGNAVFAPAAAMSFQSVDLTKEDEDDDDDDDSHGSVAVPEPPAKRQRDAVPFAVKLDEQAPPPDPPTSLSLSLPGTGAGAATPPAPPAPARPAMEAWMEKVVQNPRFREVMRGMIAEEVERMCNAMMASLGRAGAGAAVTLPTAWIDRPEAFPAGGGNQRTDG